MSIVSRIQRHTESRSAPPRTPRARDAAVPDRVHQLDLQSHLRALLLLEGTQSAQRSGVLGFEPRFTSDLGQFDTLNFSGGEPFIRPDFGEICGLFITKNGVKQIYVPTNGYFTDKCEKSLRKVLQHKSLDRFVCEISLDGMPEYHQPIPGQPQVVRQGDGDLRHVGAAPG